MRQYPPRDLGQLYEGLSILRLARQAIKSGTPNPFPMRVRFAESASASIPIGQNVKQEEVSIQSLLFLLPEKTQRFSKFIQ